VGGAKTRDESELIMTVRMTTHGWMWDDPKDIRLKNKIPDELVLSKNDVLELFPKLAQELIFDKQNGSDFGERNISRTIEGHNEWCRNYGIPLWFKRDGVWFTNAPFSPLTVYTI